MDDKENKLYSDFATRDVLDGISADNFDSLKNDAFITPENKEFFEDMLRVGWLSGQLSSSGPMPNTCQIIETAVTGSNIDTTIYTPVAGEVWQIIGIGMYMSDATVQSGTAYIKYIDSSDNTVASIVIEDSPTGSIHAFDTHGMNLYFDNNITLAARYYKSGTWTGTVRFDTVLMRVR